MPPGTVLSWRAMSIGLPGTGPGFADGSAGDAPAGDAGRWRILVLLSLAEVVAIGCAGTPQGHVATAPGAALVLPEHYAHSIAALGMPGARRAFQVGHGSVVGNGDAALEWRIVSAPGEVRTSPVYFERDGVPVAHWWMVSARESVHFEAAAAPRAALGDSNLMLSVRATATWIAREPGECVLEVRLRSRPDGPANIPWDAEDTDTHEEQWRDRFAIRNGRLVAGVEATLERAPADPRSRLIAPARGPGPGALAATGRARLARGEQSKWHYWMPAFPVDAPGAGLERIARHDPLVAEARDAWRGWLERGTQLATPDSLVNAAWRAALITLLVSHERDRGEWIPLGNPLQYRDVWLRDGARSVRALAVAGYTDVARSDAWTFTRFQLPSGALVSQRGQLDGTGQALWAFAQAATLPPAPDFAARTLPSVRRALEWIEVQRQLTRRLAIRYAGLLPYADPRDNELVQAQLVGNDAWGIAGCRAAATLARLAGADSLARAADAIASDYTAAFHAALTRSGSRDVPPSWQGAGRDWGNLAACYPTRVLAAEDPRLAALARRVWGRSGGPGLIRYAPLDTLHSYVGADLAQWALIADRPADARAYLRAMIAHSSATLGQAEVFHRDTRSFGSNLPPHVTAAAVLVDLVRNMIVCDSRDTLELALGGEAGWWRGTRFDRAVTRFGAVDVALESPGLDRRRARWGALAAPVPARVRVADGERVVEVMTPAARAVDGRWVFCPPGAQEVEFRIAPTVGAGTQAGGAGESR